MHPVTQNLIEEIRNGDLRSAMDALRGLTKFAVDLQQQLITVKTELDKKINSTSKYLDSPTTIELVGHGTVSCEANSDKVVGVGTFFMKDISVGNLIKVGSLSRSVIGIDDDTHLTVDTIFNNPFSNYSYNIIRHQNKETFKGMFEFGELTHDANNIELTNIPFKGNIAQNSYFTHYGRISDPYDLVNVRFVQNAVAPAMARALNAIQRDGDTIGRLTKKTNTNNLVDPYVYWYRNCSFKFTDQCSLDFTTSIMNVEHAIAVIFSKEQIATLRDNTFVKNGSNPDYSGIYTKVVNFGNMMESVIDYAVYKRGDSIGNGSTKTYFDVQNTEITNVKVKTTYDSDSRLKYSGKIEEADDVVNLAHLNDKLTNGAFASFIYSLPNGTHGPDWSASGPNITRESKGFDKYFDIQNTGNRITCKQSCLILVIGQLHLGGTDDAIGNFTPGRCKAQIKLLKDGGTIKAEATPEYYSNGNFDLDTNLSLFAATMATPGNNIDLVNQFWDDNHWALQGYNGSWQVVIISVP